MVTPGDVLLVAVLSIAGGIVALVAVALLPLPRRRGAASSADAALELEFEDGALLRSCPVGRRLIGAAPMASDDLGRIAALLEPQFPGLAADLDALAASGGEIAREGACAPLARLVVHGVGGRLRLRLGAAAGAGLAELVAAILAEAAGRLQAILDAAPLPAWAEDSQGRVVWANRAHLVAAGAEPATNADWPPPPLCPGPGTAETGSVQRVVSKGGRKGPPRWFDCLRQPLPGGGTVGFALPADDLVRAEMTLRGFLQTLSRTFAHLPIGLAVFDSDRRLSLFNPVLSDLTGLPPEFLARRPTLHALLDRLRELRMIPEPRDYGAWRRRLADIEQVAETGHYTELWPLPSGQTFRVTGQPDAEGGIALLIENVTGETARNRGLKARGDLLEAAIGALDRAVTVFDGGGTAVAQTPAYSRLWGTEATGDRRFEAALSRWEAASRPTPLWRALRDAAADPAARGPHEDVVIMADGRIVQARIVPLPGQGLLAEFGLRTAEPTAVRHAGTGQSRGPGAS